MQYCRGRGVPSRPRKRAGRGLAFIQLPFAEWRRDFDPFRARSVLRTRTISEALSGAEMAVLELLISHGERLLGAGNPPATCSRIAEWRGRAEGSTKRLVTRMGRSGLIVNVGNAKVFNLVMADFPYWDLELLERLRGERREIIAKWELEREKETRKITDLGSWGRDKERSRN